MVIKGDPKSYSQYFCHYGTQLSTARCKFFFSRGSVEKYSANCCAVIGNYLMNKYQHVNAQCTTTFFPFSCNSSFSSQKNSPIGGTCAGFLSHFVRAPILLSWQSEPEQTSERLDVSRFTHNFLNVAPTLSQTSKPWSEHQRRSHHYNHTKRTMV